MLHRGKLPARHGAVKHKFASLFDSSKLPRPILPFGRTGYFKDDDSVEDGNDYWGLLGNATAGCCVWSGAAHETMLWGALGGRGAPPFTKQNVLSAYSVTTGYDPSQTDANGDNPTDQGTDMVKAAQYRQQVGLRDANGVRHKIDGFVSIEVGNVQEIMLAAYLFGAIGVGAMMQADAEDQFNAKKPWSVTRASKTDGHYFPIVGANRNGDLLAVTWGRLQAVEPDWLAHCMDEGVVYISRESLRTNTLLNQRGVNWAGIEEMFGHFGG